MGVAILLKQVRAVLAAEPARNLTRLKPDGKNIDLTFGLLLRDFQRVEYLLLKIARIGDRVGRQSDYYRVVGANGLLYLDLPILTHQQVLFVQPRLEAVIAQSAAEISDLGLILRGMAQEHAQPLLARCFMAVVVSHNFAGDDQEFHLDEEPGFKGPLYIPCAGVRGHYNPRLRLTNT